MSRFWEHYEAAKPHLSAAVDDIRHKLVEEGWFGRQVTGDIASEPIERDPIKHEHVHEHRHSHSALYDELWGKEPQAGDLYGQAPAVSPGPAIEPYAAPAAPDREEGLGPEL